MNGSLLPQQDRDLGVGRPRRASVICDVEPRAPRVHAAIVRAARPPRGETSA
jgi:hypothetical protein